MKGLETRVIFGLLIFIAVIIIIMIIVFGPAIGFSSMTKSRTKFEEFCVFWSVDNYAEGWNQEVTALPTSLDWMQRTPSAYCPTVLGVNSLGDDIEKANSCRSCCKKETVC